MDEKKQRIEWLKCSKSFAYWLDSYGYLYNAQDRAWVRFRLWPEQMPVAGLMQAERYLCVLKARQLGLSWLSVGYVVWLMLFRSASTSLIFSKRDDEAVELLDQRVKGLYRRLPDWMQARAVVDDSEHEFRLSNGSVARAFPSMGGDSYTGNFVLLDEFDLHEHPAALMASVEPTISAGGQMFMVSRSDKSRPNSFFKNAYLAGARGGSRWRSVFMPWWSRPGRDLAWYEGQRGDILAIDGSLDRLYEQYPATDAEALAANSLDKRFPPQWMIECDRTAAARLQAGPALPGLTVFELPGGVGAFVGVDPAEGNPQSDFSAAVVVAGDDGRQLAVLAGRFEPGIFAGYVESLAEWYGADGVLVERNNHGHAVLLGLRESGRVGLVVGSDGRVGYLSNRAGKVALYGNAVEVVRDGKPGICDTETYTQLQSIEGGTLRAPSGMHDDRADAWALAQWARVSGGGGVVSVVVDAVDPLADMGAVW